MPTTSGDDQQMKDMLKSIKSIERSIEDIAGGSEASRAEVGSAISQLTKDVKMLLDLVRDGVNGREPLIMHVGDIDRDVETIRGLVETHNQDDKVRFDKIDHHLEKIAAGMGQFGSGYLVEWWKLWGLIVTAIAGIATAIVTAVYK